MPTKYHNFKFKWSIVLRKTENKSREAIVISLIQHFEADFLWKVSLKILNSGLILKTFTHMSEKYQYSHLLLLAHIHHHFLLGISKMETNVIFICILQGQY